jgi:hypothetical protein
MCSVMRFLFLILFRHEIGFIAEIQYYASDVLANALVGTIRSPNRYVPHCLARFEPDLQDLR